LTISKYVLIFNERVYIFNNLKREKTL